MTRQVKLQLPAEKFELIELQGNGLPAICLVNEALLEFEHPHVFAWQCSIIFDLQQLDESNMPVQSERQLMDAFFAQLIRK